MYTYISKALQLSLVYGVVVFQRDYDFEFVGTILFSLPLNWFIHILRMISPLFVCLSASYLYHVVCIVIYGKTDKYI